MRHSKEPGQTRQALRDRPPGTHHDASLLGTLLSSVSFIVIFPVLIGWRMLRTAVAAVRRHASPRKATARQTARDDAAPHRPDVSAGVDGVD